MGTLAHLILMLKRKQENNSGQFVEESLLLITCIETTVVLVSSNLMVFVEGWSAGKQSENSSVLKNKSDCSGVACLQAPAESEL